MTSVTGSCSPSGAVAVAFVFPCFTAVKQLQQSVHADGTDLQSCMTSKCPCAGEQPVSPGSLLSSNMPHAGRQSMQKLLKPLSNTSYSTASRAEAAKAGHSHIGTEAQIVDIPECSPAQQSSYGSDITARPDEELHSPRSEADSSPSCHSITGSVAGPATPAATLAHAQPASSDSSGHSELTASVCPMSERDTAATERCTMSMSMSDNASSAFDVDPGLDEAIQACSDLIAEIKNEVDRKSSVKVLSHWQPRKWMFLGSALAVCTGAFATGSCLGLHASIINWFPT